LYGQRQIARFLELTSAEAMNTIPLNILALILVIPGLLLVLEKEGKRVGSVPVLGWREEKRQQR
jgi:hypothetical protein